MPNHYVIDTNCLLGYFYNIFDIPPILSPRAKKIISNAFISTESDIKITIPSVVFIELFDKWHETEEMTTKIYYEVYKPILDSPNIEIREIDEEILSLLLDLEIELGNHDINDKIIMASAISLNCILITTDSILINYANLSKKIPQTMN